METLDLFSALEARDRGLKQVADNNLTWMDAAMAALVAFAAPRHGQIATGETVRLFLLSGGLPHPGHPNAWGALIRTAKQRGIFLDTGVWVRPLSTASHASPKPQFRIAHRHDWRG